MAATEARRIWDVADLEQALVDAGLQPTLLDAPPESGVQPSAGKPSAGREVLPWAAQMAAALAPTVRLTPADLPPKPAPAGGPPSGLVVRGADLAPSAPRGAVHLAAPVRRVDEPTVKAPRNRAGTRWPVRLCALVALAAGATAFHQSPLPISARARVEVARAARDAAVGSSVLTAKIAELAKEL